MFSACGVFIWGFSGPLPSGAADVSEELGVPPPVVHDIVLELGPVERFFYQRQQRIVTRRVLRLCSKHLPQQQLQQQQQISVEEDKTPDNAAAKRAPMAAALSSQMTALLLVLRQAANHPQLGALGVASRRGNASGTISSSSGSKSVKGRKAGEGLEGLRRYMSMDDVLCRLITDARVKTSRELFCKCSFI